MAVRDDWRYFSGEGPSTYMNDGSVAHFTVPDNTVWHILSLWVEYTASDTVATRAIRLRITDDTGDVLLEAAPGVTVTASQVRQFVFYPGAPDLTSARDTDWISTPLPAGLVLLPGWQIQLLEQSSGDTSDSEIMLAQLLGAAQPMNLQTSFGQFQSSD